MRERHRVATYTTQGLLVGNATATSRRRDTTKIPYPRAGAVGSMGRVEAPRPPGASAVPRTPRNVAVYNLHKPTYTIMFLAQAVSLGASCTRGAGPTFL
ncbi:hypothetical protein EVAR_87827_1 [Eumeta japonica]|uniref:Uncharacterized protein n=1 Tax=Eumeta variegata TaxID=151549 RepID=A0A4C1YF50_EUMVA|nr:hypothetical protein EVAR_87827_1 [Eumeta japonica]